MTNFGQTGVRFPAASSGLSRRRANVPTTTTHDDDDTAPSPPPASANPAEKSPEAAFANGSRVAYDPRDLLLSSQESAALGATCRSSRSCTVLSTRQTGETLLDETLKMMKQTEDSGERMGVAT
ncbi:hypothetical protein C8J57DRAFT_1719847 [Mycena rebaudengoi]|nr:hypothetical protein C8J57DRAFT_1719847 [Mycena rebaudengoi]